MATATITPKYVNAPGQGKKRGTVKMANDKFALDRDFLIWPNLVPSMQSGQSYNVEFDASPEGWRTITKVSPAGNGQVSQPQYNIAGQAIQPQSSSEMDKDEFIYLCGIMNNMARAGNLLPDTTENEMARVGRWVRGQWREIRKPLTTPVQQQQQPAQTRTKPTVEEDMNDEIPF